MPEDLDQQPGGVAARSGAGGQRLFRRQNARLHADDIMNLFLQLGVEVDQEVDRRVRLAWNLLEIGCEQWPGLHRLKIGRKLTLQAIGILKRKAEGIGLDEEIEGIDHGHLRREVDLYFELSDLLREDVTRQPVALWILLPVHKMVRRRDLERIAQDRRARVRRWAQPNGLRAEVDRTVVFVVRDVM